jgi:hypothetical protein
VSDSRAAPRYARPFVAVFLTALIVCALVPFNAWPFSDWELFSRLRTDRQTGWEAVAVDSAGRVRDDPIVPYRTFVSVANHFAGRSAAERDADCISWLHDASGRFGPGTRFVRIYRLEWLLSDRQGNRAAPRHRTLTWICSATGARAAG